MIDSGYLLRKNSKTTDRINLNTEKYLSIILLNSVAEIRGGIFSINSDGIMKGKDSYVIGRISLSRIRLIYHFSLVDLTVALNQEINERSLRGTHKVIWKQ